MQGTSTLFPSKYVFVISSRHLFFYIRPSGSQY